MREDTRSLRNESLGDPVDAGDDKAERISAKSWSSHAGSNESRLNRFSKLHSCCDPSLKVSSSTAGVPSLSGMSGEGELKKL